MSVFKRGDTWHFEFVFAGQRIRESAHTSRKTIAQEGEKRRRLELERALAGLPSEEPITRIANMRSLLKDYREKCETLAEGANRSVRTAAFVAERCKPLEKHLGGLLRGDLNEQAMLDYMKARQVEKVGPRTINMEVEVLSRAAGHPWKTLWPNLAKLKEPRDVGRALNDDEQARLLKAAAANKSRVIYPALHLALQTGMRSDEIKSLTWACLNFETHLLTVRRSKTDAGARRVIPMTQQLEQVLQMYMAWYTRKLGIPEQDWCVFCLSRGVKPVDPLRPTTTLKSAWERVRADAKVVARFHDLRHTAITKMLEQGKPEHTVKAIVGHVSPKMLERYAHARTEAKRDTVAALALPVEVPAWGVPTKSPTKAELKRLN